MDNAMILLLPVLLPIVAGILSATLKPLRKDKARRVFLTVALTLNLAAVLYVALQPEIRLTALYLAEKLPIYFRTDSLTKFFVILASAMFLLVGIFSYDYMPHQGDEERFYLFYMIVLGMLNAFGLAGNMLTLYLFFELTTLLSLPLVIHCMTKEAIGAAFKYLFYSIAGASLGLIGFFFIYTYGTTLEFTPGGVLDMAKLAGNEGTMLAVVLAAIIGFGAKAGMFPLHAWLPDAHPVAPAPASAVLSGVITKAGVFAIIRFVFYLVGVDFIRGTWVQYAWMGIALLTVFMGSMLAYKEPLMKRRFAYSSISQVSYALFGLSTLTAAGVLGGLLHMVFHSIIKDALFLISGAIISVTHKTAVSELRGIGRQMPVTMWCFTVVSVALVGIPPMSGFLSKWYLATGSLVSETGFLTWVGPVVLLLSALLTAGYLFPITVVGFFPGNDFDNGSLGKTEATPSMLCPVLTLTAFAFALGLFPGRLVDYFTGIVSALL